MKACPFCAEEIQDAAIVCKHCGRELTPHAGATPKRRWGRWIVIGALLLIGIPLALVYFGDEHQEFIQWSARRDAWHQRCDAYVDKPITDAMGRACKTELDALTAYAQRKGWDK